MALQNSGGMLGAASQGLEQRAITVPLGGGGATSRQLNAFGLGRVRVTAQRTGALGAVVTVTLQGSMTVDNWFTLTTPVTVGAGAGGFAEIEISGVSVHSLRCLLAAPVDAADSTIRFHIMAVVS
jgi:hypothetical protein